MLPCAAVPLHFAARAAAGPSRGPLPGRTRKWAGRSSPTSSRDPPAARLELSGTSQRSMVPRPGTRCHTPQSNRCRVEFQQTLWWPCQKHPCATAGSVAVPRRFGHSCGLCATSATMPPRRGSPTERVAPCRGEPGNGRTTAPQTSSRGAKTTRASPARPETGWRQPAITVSRPARFRHLVRGRSVAVPPSLSTSAA